MNSDLPASFVGGRVRNCPLFADPFSSPIASFGTASETGSEAIPMAPLKQRKRFTLVDSPRSEIRQGDLKVLGELHGLETGIHEVLYSYRFAPWRIVPGFYHLQPRDSAPLSNWSGRYVFMKIQKPFHYPTFWRTVGESRFLHLFPFGSRSVDSWFCFQIGGEEDVDDSSALSGGALFDEQGGNIARLPASVLYDEYQQAGTRRRHQFYAPPPRLTKMAPLDMGAGPFPPGNIIGDLLIQQVRASSMWELMKEWLERRTEHWNPSEEYRQYLFWSVEPTRLADASLRVGPESAAESRVSAGPPF
ncbi:BnaA06g20380D [Brassica napus]|uniref:BnaA06g20380D protein n=1 Tax=Brassica napus TaxID=3708 RepID=A0A078GYU7_BRANA|nr:BnaA06g20380D [Brassica napus]